MMRRFSSSRVTKSFLTHNYNNNNKNTKNLLPFLNQTIVSSPCSKTLTPFLVTISHFSSKPFFATAAVELINGFMRRGFCSETGPTNSSVPPNFAVVDSEETFNDSLRKVQDEKKPGILYFTAAWCGPCRFMSPVLEKLSETYPHVTTYKIDIDQEALGKKISEMSISAVPTLLFFKDGKKSSELIGFDVRSLKEKLTNLYN